MRWQLPFAAWLLVPVSVASAGDFQVNTTPGAAGGPSIAKGPSGDYLVAWSGGFAMARRFGLDGKGLGPDFPVNEPDPAQWPCNYTSTARFPNGGHVVAWSTFRQDFAQDGIDGRAAAPRILPVYYICNVFYRVLLPDGSPAGPPVHLGLEELNSLGCRTGNPSTATQPDGNGVVVYTQGFAGFPPVPTEIHALRFPSNGNLPDLISSSGRNGAVAAGPSGELAIAWLGPDASGTGAAIFLRLFAPDGTPEGPEVVAGSLTSSAKTAVAISSQGTIFVAWDEFPASTGSDTSGSSVQARRYAADGTSLGPQFQVNTLTTGYQLAPEVSALPDGGFLVAWESQGSYGTDGSGYSIQARRYLADGSAAGPEDQVNATEAEDQIRPDVAVDASGTPTFAWLGWLSGDNEVRASDDRTDVGIAVTDGTATTQPGATLQYVVTVTDTGPADAPAALVSTPFPPSLSCTWNCSGTGGASCGAGVHAGDIDDIANIPVGGVATYVAACLVGSGASGDLVVTAQVAAPASLIDTDPSNNTATDVTQVVGLVIDDVTVEEGNAGTTPASFVVRLLSPRPSPVTVDFATGDGTATSGSDYVSGAGSLTFAPGETLRTLDVSVLGDTTFETDETFFVTLGNVAGAPLLDDVAQGTILNDDSALPSGSLDELVHGSAEVRSLESAPGPAAIAQYWSLRQEPYSSYEVVVDGTSGDLGPEGPALERVASDGTIVQRATGAGATRSLRWVSDVPSTSERIRVQSRGCIDDCDAADVFRVRMWETTSFLARFNNSATQVTVVLLQNPSSDTVAGQLLFSGQDGSGLWQEPFSLAPGGTLALNTASIASLQSQAGAVRVASDAPYGTLQGKAVALEPATGFTFDTPLAPRPR